MATEDSFKKRILEEMSVSYANTLEKNFSLAKEFIRITSTGTVDFLGDKQDLTGTEKILLYLIGKVYAKEASLSASEYASTQELCNELGIKMGSALPWLKTLRDEGKVDAKNSQHSIKINLIEQTLKELSRKIKKNG